MAKLASLASSRGTFVGSSRRRRKSKTGCRTSTRCRSSWGRFTMCGFGVKRYKLTSCRNKRGRFATTRRYKALGLIWRK